MLKWSLVFAVLQVALTNAAGVPHKSYACVAGICELKAPSNDSRNGMSQNTCLMTCGNGNLWPYPTGQVSIEGKFAAIKSLSSNFVFNFDSSVLKSASEEFYNSIRATKSSFKNSKLSTIGVNYVIEVNVADQSTLIFSMGVDESYSLKTLQTDAGVTTTISANTVFGARHGIETLAQLVTWDQFTGSFVVASAVAIDNDKPEYVYRGVMVDTSRHFQPIDSLKRTVRALSYNKMNILHLHLSDAQSFPVVLEKQTNLSYYGAYSDTDAYTLADLADLASYANDHGVQILPELDGPSHVAMGYQWGREAGLGDLVICTDPQGVEQDKWTGSGYEPATGQLNIGNENIYPVLADVHAEILNALSLSSVFHVGGDEIMVGTDETDISCYNSTTKATDILELLKEKGLDRNDRQSFFDLWADYIKKVEVIVDDAYAGKHANPSVKLQKLHIWGGGGQDSSGVVYNIVDQPNVNTVLPQNKYTIQVWDESDGSITPELIKQGYDVVLSNTDYVYMDCGNYGWTQPGGYWCGPYHEWQHMYNYLLDAQNKWNVANDADLTSGWSIHALGSETLAWGETIGPSNIDQKLWPRTSGLAEALWGRTTVTPKKAETWYDADPRMQHWSTVLRQRGIDAEPLQAQWCDQRGAYACTVNAGTPA